MGGKTAFARSMPGAGQTSRGGLVPKHIGGRRHKAQLGGRSRKQNVDGTLGERRQVTGE
jgi:hypothetical protein